MINLMDYVSEIWTVARERNVDIGVATDMFLADVNNGEAKPCNTAGSLPNFDFIALQSELGKMSLAEQETMLAEWRDFRRENYEKICDAFADGEGAVIALVDKWRAEHENN